MIKLNGKLFLSVCVFMCSFQPAQASTADEAGQFRVMAKGAIGQDYFIARAKNASAVSSALTKTAVAGPLLGAEYFVFKGIALGVQAQGLFEIGTKTVFQDYSMYGKFLLPHDSSGDNSEIYLTVPGGFSRVTDAGKAFADGVGFNVGLLFGYNYFFNDYVGISGDVGYMFRHLNTKVKVAQLSIPAALQMHELAATMGLVFRI